MEGYFTPISAMIMLKCELGSKQTTGNALDEGFKDDLLGETT
jgi:hypothetical protein